MSVENLNDPNIDSLDDDHQVPSSLRPLLDGERHALELIKAHKVMDLSTNDLVVDDPATAGAGTSRGSNRNDIGDRRFEDFGRQGNCAREPALEPCLKKSRSQGTRRIQVSC